MRYAIAMLTTAAALFIAMAANTVLEQQRLIAAARPVRGTVVSSGVGTSTSTDPKDRGRTLYRPMVRYRFTVGQAIYTSGRVFPTSPYTSRQRAEQIVAEHPVGKDVTVWLDPARAMDSSFLVREWDFAPYLTILLAMIFLSIGLGFWAAAPWRREKWWPPKALPGGGFEVPICASLASRRRPWRVVVLVWFVLGGVVAGHYFMHADQPYELAALVAAPLYALLGLIPVWFYVRHLRLGRRMRDARVIVNAEAFRLGKTFDVRVEQAYRKPTRLASVRLGLVCEKMERVTGWRGRRATAYESWVDLKADEEASAARPLSARGKLTAPADAAGTTAEGYSWRIAVAVRRGDGGEYRADYPIVVVAAAE